MTSRRYRLSAVLGLLALMVALFPAGTAAAQPDGEPVPLKSQQHGQSWEDFFTRGDCKGVELEPGEVLWHLVASPLDADAEATLTPEGLPGQQSGQAGAMHWTIVNTSTTVNDSWTAWFTAGKRDNTELRVSHACSGGEADPEFGGLVVEKAVAGEGQPDPDAEFVVAVDCDGVAHGPFTFGPAGGSATVADDLPADTQCTVTETGTGGADATFVVVDPADEDALGEQGTATTITIAADVTVRVRFTNVFGEDEVQLTGTLAVEKVVTGDGEPHPDTTFAFEVDCDGVDLGDAGGFSLGADGGRHELGVALPVGTDCTVTETGTGGADATLVGPDGDETAGTSATVTIEEEHTVVVRFTNVFDDEEVEPEVGGLVVQKVVIFEDERDPDAEFVVAVECGGVAYGPFTFGADGGTRTVADDLEPDTECTLTETEDGGADLTLVVVDPDDDDALGEQAASATVTVGANETVLVRFTNAFALDEVLPTGTLAVEKVVAGDGKPEADATFEVEVDCDGIDLGGAGKLSFGAEGGEAQLGVDLPEDTKCTVTETGDGGADATFVVVDPAGDEAGKAGDSATATIAAGVTVRVRFTNVFDVDVVKVVTPPKKRDVTKKPDVTRKRDVTEVLGPRLPTRVDAGAGGTAPSPRWRWIVALLLGAAVAALAVSERRRRTDRRSALAARQWPWTPTGGAA